MEEEDEKAPVKRAHKRKSKKDTLPQTDQESDDEREDYISRHRFRKSRDKIKKQAASLSGNSDESEHAETELQQIYRVVECLLTAPGYSAFMERPDNTLYGMSDYYEIITNPMWLKEVVRKYEEGLYTSATEVAADVRLMFENCYQYWGPCDVLSKRALKLEQLFEQKLAQTSAETQKLCCLATTHGEMDIEDQSDDSASEKLPSKGNVTQQSRRSVTANKKGSYVSKLLKWVLSGRRKKNENGTTETQLNTQESHNIFRRSEREETERKLLQWESEFLLTGDVMEQISSMWEFAEIGQFLFLVYNVLNIEPIAQTELERMLLMPEASKTLATLITSMLIPPLARSKLEAGPAMPYSIWTNKLSTKVSSWYRVYHSKGDSTVEVFDSIGIDPHFWLVMGEENPLDEYLFHELNFLQRVWILKALCDYIFHNHKTIQDCINNIEVEELREKKLGKDKDGFTYHYFPMFSEVRIYRQARVPEKRWSTFDSGVDEAITVCAEEDDTEDNEDDNITGYSRRPLHRPPRSVKPNKDQFKLVADSVEGIRCLIDDFCDADMQLLQGRGSNAGLVSKLQSILTQLEPIESKINISVYNVRTKMQQEWMDFMNRGGDYVDPGLSFWERRHQIESEEKPVEMINNSVTTTEEEKRETRERRTKRETQYKMLQVGNEDAENSDSHRESSDENDDNSSDEWLTEVEKRRRRKKKPTISVRKLKKLTQLQEKLKSPVRKDTCELNISSVQNPGSTVGVNSSNKLSSSETTKMQAISIKQEVIYPGEDVDESHSQVHLSVHDFKEKQFQGDVKQIKQSSDNHQLPVCKQEPTEEKEPDLSQTVIKTLVPVLCPSSTGIDISKVKRSSSPDPEPEPEIVYISDTDEPLDIKPDPKKLMQANQIKTINYSMNLPDSQTKRSVQHDTIVNQSAHGFLSPELSSSSQSQTVNYVPLNVIGDQLYTDTNSVHQTPYLSQQNSVVAVRNTQPPLQSQGQIAYTQNYMSGQPVIQQQIIGSPQTVLRMSASPRHNVSSNQKFVVIQQPNTNSPTNQSSLFPNKSPVSANKIYPNTSVQNISWYNPQTSLPQTNTRSPQTVVRYSPRQRNQNFNVIQPQSPQQTTVRRVQPRTPNQIRVQRFTPPSSGRSQNSIIRTPSSSAIRTQGSNLRTPTSVSRNVNPITPTRGRPNQMRGAIRNLNFSPSKSVRRLGDITPAEDPPDIEGTLVVGITDSGGFGYVVMLPDGGKISLTQEQLAKIRSDNGGTLPKTCKVPLNVQTPISVIKID